MPIHSSVSVANLSAEALAAVDYRVMGHAFASQNQLGRLCDECAYNADLKARLLADGFCSVWTQVPITVKHRDFAKTYFADLIADDALYELKVSNGFTSDHDAQLLNYILLLGIQRGKLLNFRTPKVEGKIIATSLLPADRRQFNTDTSRWHDLTPACGTLRQTLDELLSDWGAFLEVALYQDALTHFIGGTDRVEQRLPLHRDGVDLGAQRFLLHAPDVAFRVTAFTGNHEAVESHLRRLLALTDLMALQWINLNHARIELSTLFRDSPALSSHA